MPRFTFDLLVTARRAERAAGSLEATVDQRVEWRPLPNERRSRERRGTQGFARFTGPGGDVEHTMSEREARAIAQALGIPFEAAPDERRRTPATVTPHDPGRPSRIESIRRPGARPSAGGS